METQLKKIFQFGFMLILACALISSCQKIEADISGQDKPIVQGYLAADHTVEVKVSNQLLFALADTSMAVGGLTLTLSVDGKDYPMTQVDTVYRSPVVVEKDKVYSVRFSYKDKNITATTTIPDAPVDFQVSTTTYVITPFNSSGGGFPTFPDPITLTWSNPDQSNYLVVVKNIETNPVAINSGIANGRVFAFRSNPLQNNTFDIRAMQFQHYGRHQVILYKINAEYAELYQSNGTSSLNIKTPYSNVTNGLGIFTGINADTVLVNVVSK